MLCVMKLKFVKSSLQQAVATVWFNSSINPWKLDFFQGSELNKVPIKKCQWSLFSSLPSGMQAPGEQGSVSLLIASFPGLEWHLAHRG